MLTPERIEELAGPFVRSLGGGPWVTGEDGIREFEIEDFARAVEAAATAEARALVRQLVEALRRSTKHEEADFQALEDGRAWLSEAQKGDGHDPQ